MTKQIYILTGVLVLASFLLVLPQTVSAFELINCVEDAYSDDFSTLNTSVFWSGYYASNDGSVSSSGGELEFTPSSPTYYNKNGTLHSGSAYGQYGNIIDRNFEIEVELSTFDVTINETYREVAAGMQISSGNTYFGLFKYQDDDGDIYISNNQYSPSTPQTLIGDVDVTLMIRRVGKNISSYYKLAGGSYVQYQSANYTFLEPVSLGISVYGDGYNTTYDIRFDNFEYRCPSQGVGVNEYEDVYRFWSENFRSHFYTISETERDKLINNDPNWRYEGIAFRVKSNSGGLCPVWTRSVWRFYSNVFNSHVYTSDSKERNKLQKDPNWAGGFEGIAFCALVMPDSQVSEFADYDPQRVHRFHNVSSGRHFLTSSISEIYKLEYNDPAWDKEHIMFYSF